MEREPNTIYTLSLSYGKDSLACLGAIEKLGLPLDRIVHAEVWATETIPADLPPMVEFKKKADKIIKKQWGIEVEHVYATKKNGGGCLLTSSCLTQEQTPKSTESISTVSQNEVERGALTGSNKLCLPKLTYEDIFYREMKHRGGGYDYTVSPSSKDNGATHTSKCKHSIMGFATKWSQYCTGELKRTILNKNMWIPHINQKGELVYKPQNESFPKAQARWAV